MSALGFPDCFVGASAQTEQAADLATWWRQINDQVLDRLIADGVANIQVTTLDSNETETAVTGDGLKAGMKVITGTLAPPA